MNPKYRIRTSFAERPRRALANYNFRLYFAGQMVSQSGTWMQRTAQAWLVLDLTGSSLALGLVTALQFGPILLLSLVSGVVADRIPKRTFLILVQTAMMVQSLILATLTLTHQIQLWHVYALALWQGLANAFDGPTRQSFVGEMVGREELPAAVGLNSSVFSTARIFGPAVAGVVIAVWGLGWCFLANGLSFIAVLAGLLLMKTDRLHPFRRPRAAPLASQLADGVRYTARSPQLVFPLLVLAFLGTFGYNFGVTIPLLARFGLNQDSIGFGAMNAAMGIGSLAGALAAATRSTPSPRILLLGATGFGCVLLAAAVAPWYWLTLGLLLVLGVLSVTYSSSTNSMLQLGSEEEYRGRVLSLYTLLFQGSTPIGGALTGALADFWGIRATLVIEALLCILGAVAGRTYLGRSLPPPAAGIARTDQT
ncbi:MAG TPA: MFS transporter [Chloroflexota bacterium]